MKTSVHRRKQGVVITVLIVLALIGCILNNSPRNEPLYVFASGTPPVSSRSIHTPKPEEHSLTHSTLAILASSFVKLKLEKVVDVQLDEKEAFFLSILSINDTLIASYRDSLSAYTSSVIQLDGNFIPRAETKSPLMASKMRGSFRWMVRVGLSIIIS